MNNKAKQANPEVYSEGYKEGYAEGFMRGFQSGRQVSPPDQYEPKGCSVCGLGNNGKAYGYVCPRNECPTKVWADV